MATGVLVPLFFRTFRTHGGNAANRANLLGIYSNLTVGMSECDAARTVSNRLTAELKLVSLDEGLFLRMPLEWGASDWNLTVECSNRAVTSVRIRTSDGPAPLGAPRDKP
jgi:hypothetical protein